MINPVVKRAAGESTAMSKCCIDCLEQSFEADTRYMISTSANDPKNANVAAELVRKLQQCCARQGTIWRVLPRENFGTGKGYQLLLSDKGDSGRRELVAIVTECLPEEITLEPRTWSGGDNKLTTLFAPFDNSYVSRVGTEGAPLSDEGTLSQDVHKNWTRMVAKQQKFFLKNPTRNAGPPQTTLDQRATDFLCAKKQRFNK